MYKKIIKIEIIGNLTNFNMRCKETVKKMAKHLTSSIRSILGQAYLTEVSMGLLGRVHQQAFKPVSPEEINKKMVFH
jgi:hypothetical protein